MRLTLQNHIVCADYGQVHLDARVVGQIIDYTAETWQPDRPKKERECNIEQGKIESQQPYGRQAESGKAGRIPGGRRQSENLQPRRQLREKV